MVPGSRALGPAFSTITIADGSPQVGFARLGGDVASGSFAALVRFPEGWTRPPAGHYLVDEEFLVLEGELTLSAVTYTVDDYAYLPAGYLREGTATPRGALVIAFFGGRADWIRGAAPSGPRDAIVGPLSWRAVPAMSSPVAARSRPLRAGGDGATWLAEGALAARAPRDSRVELFSLATRAWADAAPGEAMPVLDPPCLCRLREAG